MNDPNQRRRLGRGLSALLGDENQDYADLERTRTPRTIPIGQISPGRYQPRHRFDDEEMQSLVDSVREKGILQPILVRRDPLHADQYEIIAGERRWRAAQKAQLHEVPVLVRELNDQEAAEIALIENIQRENLSPIEEAEGYRRLIDEFAHTQDVLAKALGKSRSHVANTMRLLSLPDTVRAFVDAGQLSAGHARALVGREDAEVLARQIVEKGLTVREAEQLTQRPKTSSGKTRSSKPRTPGKDADTLALERDLSEVLGLTVSVDLKGKGGSGSITIEYSDFEQLDDIVQRLNRHNPRSHTSAGPASGAVVAQSEPDPDARSDDTDTMDIPSRPPDSF